MSKAKIGDKFIIEIADIIDGGDTGCPQYRIEGFDKVFFDDKGLKKLIKCNEEDIDAACQFGAESMWKIAHDIMCIPIHDRARLFGVSHNRASFKDLSEKFNIEDAINVYKAWKKIGDVKRKEEIQDKLKEFAKQNHYSLTELKTASKMLLRKASEENKN